MSNLQVRTDLALEAKENVEELNTSINGVRMEEYYLDEEDIRVTKVVISTKNAAKIIGKPQGKYVTMEAPALMEPDDGYHREISEVLARELTDMIPDSTEEHSVLVVGLGNREVTADALGPNVVDNLLITRHVVKTYGKAAYNCEKMNLVSSIEPGVMAKTGMETSEIVKGVVEETKPDVLIVIDALAARSTRRLNRTIQITDTGIWPGSGVGNHRHPLTRESLGVPVIAIGVPTVVDAATIVSDAMDSIMDGKFDRVKSFGQYSSSMTELNNMYMTGKDIDAVIKRVSYTVSEGINIAMDMSKSETGTIQDRKKQEEAGKQEKDGNQENSGKQEKEGNQENSGKQEKDGNQGKTGKQEKDGNQGNSGKKNKDKNSETTGNQNKERNPETTENSKADKEKKQACQNDSGRYGI